MSRPSLFRSLRVKVLVVTLTLQALLLALLIHEQADRADAQLREQAGLRVQELSVLLNAALAAPMAQLDYASAQEILDEARTSGSLAYLRLHDARDRLVAHAGDARRETRKIDSDIQLDDDRVFDTRFSIVLAGQRLGTLYVGVPTAFLGQARRQMYRESLLVAGLALLLSAGVLSISVVGLTRRLEFLAKAADHVSQGEFEVRLPQGGHDEVARVTEAFNRMTDSLGQREKELRESQNHLLYLAERDSLTGLYNRHYLRQELQQRLREQERQDGLGAVMLFDLDDFKGINDTLGHQAGDALLVRVAGEAERLIRRSDIFCRLGGDEFVVIVPSTTEEQLAVLAERIVRGIGEIRFEAEGASLRTSCSLGAALYPKHGADPETLLAHADAAMYRAKQAGKNVWKLYQAELDASERLMVTLSWRERIVAALEEDGLRLHFQGIHAMPDARLAHLEALVRMVDPATGGLIPPGQFIGVAEKLGLIVQLDRWVIRQSVRLLARNLNAPPIAINISGRSFDEPDLPDYIADQLREHRVPPQRLIIELTETAAVGDLADAQRFIQALRRIGCMVCLDDFGAGFASFAYLKHIQADAIKIDGMFIRDLPQDHQNQVFVKAMVEVAKGLGVTTIAECVEDAATFDMLRDFGVEHVQGYYLDRPRPDHPAVIACG